VLEKEILQALLDIKEILQKHSEWCRLAERKQEERQKLTREGLQLARERLEEMKRQDAEDFELRRRKLGIDR
jgi:hypothetical protein